MRTKRIAMFACCLFLLSSVALCQSGKLSRNTNLRSAPRISADTVIRTLPKGTQVQLRSSKQKSGFYHVSAGSEDGWVLARNLRIVGEAPTPTATSAPSDTVSTDWEKPDPHTTVLHSSEGDCGETGAGGDSLTNTRKNRADVPASYHPVTFEAISKQSFPPGAKRSRQDWTSAQLDAIKPVEGAPISVEAYLYKIKVESYSPTPGKSGGESTNCHFHLAEDVDWHMPLTAKDGGGEDTSVIVETTPRIRQKHPNWTTARLKSWTANMGKNPNANYNHHKVRISGWLMLDPEHQDMINNGLRSTLWEIHPITKIEVQQADGTWVDLDQ